MHKKTGNSDIAKKLDETWIHKGEQAIRALKDMGLSDDETISVKAASQFEYYSSKYEEAFEIRKKKKKKETMTNVFVYGGIILAFIIFFILAQLGVLDD